MRHAVFLSTLSLRRATQALSVTGSESQFLSTLSLRRATAWRLFSVTGMSYFYPRSPCGERPATTANKALQKIISIHALLAESDQQERGNRKAHVNFYPRSPCGERRSKAKSKARLKDFYPRSPCGERQFINKSSKLSRKFLSTLSLRRATHWQVGQKRFRQFLSTLSLRRATWWLRCWQLAARISIHALLAESDMPRWETQRSK